jgi:hypothetical protein
MVIAFVVSFASILLGASGVLGGSAGVELTAVYVFVAALGGALGAWAIDRCHEWWAKPVLNIEYGEGRPF